MGASMGCANAMGYRNPSVLLILVCRGGLWVVLVDWVNLFRRIRLEGGVGLPNAVG